MWDVPSSPGPLVPAAAPTHAPPSFAGFGYPLPHLGFRLLAAALPRPLPPFPGSLTLASGSSPLPSHIPCPPSLALSKLTTSLKVAVVQSLSRV